MESVAAFSGMCTLRWENIDGNVADLPTFEVASITGHKTPVMLKRYTHFADKKLADKSG